MSWSPQQEGALKAVNAWLADPDGPQVFRLFGYAGTGKTTLARELASGISGRVLFAAFTGKAALVLSRKGCPASTIHSLVYKVEDANRAEPTFVLDPESPVGYAKLVVIDECSMVSDQLAEDLLSFKTRILVLGDPAQLPPVDGSGYFTEGCTPDFMLTEVHRQAADNPIIRMSMDIRQGRRLQIGSYGESRVVRIGDFSKDDVLAADQVLVGKNATRQNYNDRIREIKGLPYLQPVVGDKLICLKNDKDMQLLNGGLHIVTKVERSGNVSHSLRVAPEDSPKDEDSLLVRVRREFFAGTERGLDWKQRRGFQEFTFGYAMTVHKSQGSQWDSVLLVDESRTFRESAARWLYTGVTRAAERITIAI